MMYGSIMFTDIVGSSKLWAKNKQQMNRDIDAHFKRVAKLSDEYNGLMVKNIGDAFMLFFKGKHSLKRAISFGIALITSERAFQLRIGVCEGPVEVRKYVMQKCNISDYFGTTVNTASRLESKVATPGAISFGVIPSTHKFSSRGNFDFNFIDHEVTRYVRPVDLSRCKIDLQKRSSRMLTGQHIVSSACKTVDELHGVPPIEAYTIHVT